eukprot:6193353-Pleurochrysis_carterae.AAC.1
MPAPLTIKGMPARLLSTADYLQASRIKIRRHLKGLLCITSFVRPMETLSPAQGSHARNDDTSAQGTSHADCLNSMKAARAAPSHSRRDAPCAREACAGRARAGTTRAAPAGRRGASESAKHRQKATRSERCLRLQGSRWQVCAPCKAPFQRRALLCRAARTFASLCINSSCGSGNEARCV